VPRKSAGKEKGVLAVACPSTAEQDSVSGEQTGMPKLARSGAASLPGGDPSRDAGTGGSEEALPDSWDRVKDRVRSTRIELKKGRVKQKANRIGFSSFLQGFIQ
jgi:hypothetical protein